MAEVFNAWTTPQVDIYTSKAYDLCDRLHPHYTEGQRQNFVNLKLSTDQGKPFHVAIGELESLLDKSRGDKNES